MSFFYFYAMFNPQTDHIHLHCKVKQYLQHKRHILFFMNVVVDCGGIVARQSSTIKTYSLRALTKLKQSSENETTWIVCPGKSV